jgi:two-component system OmpR family response regulator
MYALSSFSPSPTGWAVPGDPVDPVIKDRRILLLQDDTSSRESLTRYLSDHGYLVQPATHLREMEDILRLSPVDLVIYNAGASADMGLELCQKLSRPEGPCLIMVGAFDDTDRILSLELGADDYLAAPFNPRELLARIKAVLRRRGPGTLGYLDHRCRYFLGFRFEFGSFMLRRLEGPPISLTPGESALLSVFLTHPGRVLSREELLEQARDDTDVFDRVIDVQVSRLRQKLAPFAASQVIRTHRHAGYQFVAEVR